MGKIKVKILKLINLGLILFIKSTIFAMNLSEIKVKEEDKSSFNAEIQLAKIKAYRSKCLNECGLYPVLSDLVQEYDPIEDKWECEQTLQGHTDTVNALCVLPRNKLASASADKTIKIWDLVTSNCERTLRDKENSNDALCVLPGNKLALGFCDSTIKIWDPVTDKYEKT